MKGQEVKKKSPTFVQFVKNVYISELFVDSPSKFKIIVYFCSPKYNLSLIIY